MSRKFTSARAAIVGYRNQHFRHASVTLPRVLTAEELNAKYADLDAQLGLDLSGRGKKEKASRGQNQDRDSKFAPAQNLDQVPGGSSDAD